VRTAAALREALLALLERKPFDQITIRGICAEAGVHYATFFRHHPSKEALLDHVATRQIEELVALTLPIFDVAGDDNAFLALCRYVEEHRRLWSVLLNGGAGRAMREEWLRQSRCVASHRESVNSWLPRELGAVCSVSLIADTIAWWLAEEPGTVSAEDVAGILHRLLSWAVLSKED
jgi:AcrR family transcriptional regulator